MMCSFLSLNCVLCLLSAHFLFYHVRALCSVPCGRLLCDVWYVQCSVCSVRWRAASSSTFAVCQSLIKTSSSSSSNSIASIKHRSIQRANVYNFLLFFSHLLRASSNCKFTDVIRNHHSRLLMSSFHSLLAPFGGEFADTNRAKEWRNGTSTTHVSGGVCSPPPPSSSQPND